MGLLDRVFGKRGSGGSGETPQDQMLDDLREPAIWLARVEGVTTKSRLGGLPSLPGGIDWPRQTQSGTPLHFLAQIDLSELPATPLDASIDDARLPSSGMLFFFADIEEEMLWEDYGGPEAATRVIYARKPGPERDPPADMPEVGHAWGEVSGTYSRGIKVFPGCSVKAHVIDTFAGDFEGDVSERADELSIASIERAIGRPLPALDRGSERDAIDRHSAAWLESRDAKGAPIPGRRELHFMHHQMLGVATNVQGTAEGAREAGHVLLLQLDSDWGVDRYFMFCDMGMAQFWIKPEDLAAGRFDRAWGTTEGG